MEFSSVLSKVQKLIAVAEDPATPPEAAVSYHAQAHNLMLKYAIDEAEARMARPAQERVKGEMILLPLARYTTEDEYCMIYAMLDLLVMVGEHCRCLVRCDYHTRDDDRTFMAKVYGYPSDLRFAEYLYTTLRLHMLGAVRPTWDPAESFDENCYRLHAAGYNWLDMARMNGYRNAKSSDLTAAASGEQGYDVYDIKDPWVDIKDNDKIVSVHKVGSMFKRGCQRATRAHEGSDAQHKVINAGSARYYRVDAVDGYVTGIRGRLRHAAGESVSTALALSAESLLDQYREDNPSAYTRCPACNKLSDNSYDCDRCGHHMKDIPEAEQCPRCKVAREEYEKNKRQSPYCAAHKPRKGKYRDRNMDGYRAGHKHAQSADLNPGGRVEHVTRPINA